MGYFGADSSYIQRRPAQSDKPRQPRKARAKGKRERRPRATRAAKAPVAKAAVHNQKAKAKDPSPGEKRGTPYSSGASHPPTRSVERVIVPLREKIAKGLPSLIIPETASRPSRRER